MAFSKIKLLINKFKKNRFKKKSNDTNGAMEIGDFVVSKDALLDRLYSVPARAVEKVIRAEAESLLGKSYFYAWRELEDGSVLFYAQLSSEYIEGRVPLLLCLKPNRAVRVEADGVYLCVDENYTLTISASLPKEYRPVSTDDIDYSAATISTAKLRWSHRRRSYHAVLVLLALSLLLSVGAFFYSLRSYKEAVDAALKATSNQQQNFTTVTVRSKELEKLVNKIAEVAGRLDENSYIWQVEVRNRKALFRIKCVKDTCVVPFAFYDSATKEYHYETSL